MKLRILGSEYDWGTFCEIIKHSKLYYLGKICIKPNILLPHDPLWGVAKRMLAGRKMI